jgi:hypothetical protein
MQWKCIREHSIPKVEDDASYVLVHTTYGTLEIIKWSRYSCFPLNPSIYWAWYSLNSEQTLDEKFITHWVEIGQVPT